ncbi:MAG: type II toxin-antitoxin system Phd/YefM family antitoxin [Anaerolinea sp.]|nr:type II toxin-antitoxin system Phd/YefM family antitoxin [Anaerolinea sp.]
MTITCSIADARNQFAALIRQVEDEHMRVQVTRRGEPVAVILSQNEYEDLLAQRPKRDFWTAYQQWRQEWDVETWDEDENFDPFADVRDRSPGREVNPWA